MQIRGEAAIACGFMAGLATGLLFDGCFDSYINRFCDSDFPRGWPRKTAPARQKADAPIKSRSVAASKTKVIVIKNGKIYHRSGGCKNLPQNAIRTSVPLATALKRGKTPLFSMLPASGLDDSSGVFCKDMGPCGYMGLKTCPHGMGHLPCRPALSRRHVPKQRSSKEFDTNER